ncbi:glycosyltransferase family 2 protein [Vibrio vulnificus]|nr:glycosyltransferase family 2 protein [Vibrio vulnificus]
MKISIIIPVYNVEDYIEECLTSIKNQSYQDFEVVIVDDCGQDSSIKKTFGYLNDPRFKLIQHEKNKGPGGARNTALKNSLGDFVFYLDSDDVLHPNALKLLVDAQNQSGADLVFSKSFKFSSNEKPCFIDDSKVIGMSSVSGEDIITARGFAVWGALINKIVLVENKLSFPEGVYGEDVPLLSLLLQSAKSTCLIENQLVAYRWLRKDSVTTYSVKHARDMLYLLDQYFSKIKNDAFATFVVFNVVGKIIEMAYLNERKEILCDLSNKKKYTNLKSELKLRKSYSYLSYKNKLLYFYIFTGNRVFLYRQWIKKIKKRYK